MNVLIFILLIYTSLYAQTIDSILIDSNVLVFLPQEIIENRNTKLFTWKGKVLNKKTTGKGILSYKEKEVYKGEMQAGYFQGAGKLTYRSGVYFQGFFKKSLENGKGKLVYDENGHRVEATWEDGKMEGIATEFGIMGMGEEHYRISLLEDNIIKQILLERTPFFLSKYENVNIGDQKFIKEFAYWSGDTLSSCSEVHFLDQNSRKILKVGLHYSPNTFEPTRIAIYKDCAYNQYYNSRSALLTVEIQFDNLGDKILDYQITGYKNLCFLKKHEYLLQLFNSRGDCLKTLTIEEIKNSRKNKF